MKRLKALTLVRPHGVRGDMKAKVFLENLDSLTSYPLYNDKGDRVEVTLKGESKGLVILRLPTVQNRNMAENMRGVNLYIARDDLPPLNNTDEFYIEDLKDLTVLNSENQEVGHVSGVMNYGAGDIVEITQKNGEKTLYPFTLENFPHVDVKLGNLVLAMK